jgi:hypothetical protein
VSFVLFEKVGVGEIVVIVVVVVLVGGGFGGEVH